MKTFFLFLFSVQVLVAQENIRGCYASVNCFTSTLVEFKKDSTFNYQMRGDLLYDESKGIYHIKEDTVFLLFKEVKPRYERVSINGDSVDVLMNITELRFSKGRPNKFYIHKKCLYEIDVNDKVTLDKKRSIGLVLKKQKQFCP